MNFQFSKKVVKKTVPTKKRPAKPIPATDKSFFKSSNVSLAQFKKKYFERAIYFERLALNSRATNRLLENTIRALKLMPGSSFKVLSNDKSPAQKMTNLERLQLSNHSKFFENQKSSFIGISSEYYSSAIRKAANSLQRSFSTKVACNIYFTPKNQQTLPLHTDDHDVIVVQAFGTKKWRIYHKKSTKLLTEITMQPGDLLYIPSGFPHQALAESKSLHLTFGLQTIRIYDIMLWMGAHLQNEFSKNPFYSKFLYESQLDARGLQEVRTSILKNFKSSLHDSHLKLFFQLSRLRGNDYHPAYSKAPNRNTTRILATHRFCYSGLPFVLLPRQRSETITVALPQGCLVFSRKFRSAFSKIVKGSAFSARSEFLQSFETIEIQQFILAMAKARIINEI